MLCYGRRAVFGVARRVVSAPPKQTVAGPAVARYSWNASDAQHEPSPRESVEAIIEGNRGVLMFGEKSSKFTQAAERSLREGAVDVELLHIDDMAHREKVEQGLAELTGKTSLPQIYVGKCYVGGAFNLAEGIGNGSFQALLDIHKIKHNLN
mmetsp:Transcript_7087/g.11256  ORF Transcript_7087/g.11256 Transcript_7087/m.11256 type:complete len:152 (+) Transcript_7087:248-703(+)|eukprot:CAMPEP_0203745860 /NCGR_PEP_ID=MMETSP0098-20131031/1473_1 /ASSEMBLY_ACC=CAM_ASM_000208 /TAXON_ID=96639 /ORGANISM=" , Strain NY0313808BC1" /LENGTH=151 /DNA_ID=CAMNT_0050633767 /DNA_START=217 /DNA_END=669 /DNA_ORIENTATION=+